MTAVVRIRAGRDGGREVGGEGLVVDHVRGEQLGMDGIHQIEEITVVGIRRVGVEHLGGAAVPARRELDDGDVRLHERDILGTNPRRPDEVLPVLLRIVRATAEDAEVELLSHGALADAVVSVEVIVEGLERALPETARVGLQTDDLAVSLRPVRHRCEIARVALALAGDVEGVEELLHALEARRAVDAEIHAPANLHLREALAQHGGDERGGRGDDVGEEPLVVHVAKRSLDEVRQFGTDRPVAIAVAVEERVEQDAVLAAPAQIIEETPSHLVREFRRRTAAEHARPGEEHLADTSRPGRTRLDERLIEEVAHGQVFERFFHGEILAKFRSTRKKRGGERRH